MTTTINNKVLTLGHVGRGTGIREPFDAIFEGERLVGARTISSSGIDALVIWGGEDINPRLYNETESRFMYGGAGAYGRDNVEVPACQQAIELGIPIIGVCRGAQLVCALAGGRLIQHVENHGRSHNIITRDGRVVRTTSVHHQMMYPFDVDHEMLAWSVEDHRSPVHIGEDSKHDTRMDDKVEPEIVWFPKIKALAIQGHPEFVSNPDESPFVQLCLEYVKEYIL